MYDIENELRARRIRQASKELKSFARFGVALVVLDIVLFAVALSDPGRWFHTLLNNWIFPIIAAIGGFVFIFSANYLFSLIKDYKACPEEREKIESLIIKSIIFIVGYIGLWAVSIACGLSIPEEIFVIDWV